MYSNGFPSPAEHEQATPLSLDRYLIDHPLATFFVRVAGEALRPRAILDGDILVVDRAVVPQVGDLVVAVRDGALTVEALQPGVAVEVWGVVVGVVRKARRKGRRGGHDGLGAC
jgi:SOS-response transcriptional repressor LexA